MSADDRPVILLYLEIAVLPAGFLGEHFHKEVGLQFITGQTINKLAREKQTK